jgi:hypothetical protein
MQLLISMEISQNARSGAAATENLRNQAAEQFHQSSHFAARMMRLGPPSAPMNVSNAPHSVADYVNGTHQLTITAKIEE